MRVSSLTIENCKSYREPATLELDPHLNVLVGPNGGGKSNTLDILTIALRHFFLPAYTVSDSRQSGVLMLDIVEQPLFRPVTKFLDPHSDRDGDPFRVSLEMEVGASDQQNFRTMLERGPEFERALLGYRNKPRAEFSILGSWDPDAFVPGRSYSFEIEGDRIEPGSEDAGHFRAYLLLLQLGLFLAPAIPDLDLSPTFLYFSPYRSASPQDLNAALSTEQFFNLLHEYFGTTSRTTTSLIKAATVFFAEKRRRLELQAQDSPYRAAWDSDPDVVLVTRHLAHLGYDWELRLVDPNKNTYEIVLARDGREFLISQASSGEKEVLNFLFGIFALRTKGGLLIVDEPELHLHPRWQAALRDLFRELAHTTGNQFLLSTHSPVFITPETVTNVRRVSREDGSTRLISIDVDERLGDARSLLHIINSHNNERVFFADRVVMVEGVHDRVLFEALFDRYSAAVDSGEVVEVLEVHGKANFARYRSFLERLRVPSATIADLDHALELRREQLSPLMEIRFDKIDREVFRAKKSQDRIALAETLESFLAGEDPSPLRDLWTYITGRFARLRDELSRDEQETLDSVLGDLASEGVYVLPSGEIEDYLPAGHRTLDQTIALLEPDRLAAWLGEEDEGLLRLEFIVCAILDIPAGEIGSVRHAVIDALAREAERLASTIDGSQDASGVQPATA